MRNDDFWNDPVIAREVQKIETCAYALLQAKQARDSARFSFNLGMIMGIGTTIHKVTREAEVTDAQANRAGDDPE